MQNNIKEILLKNPFIPVATINSAADVEVIHRKLVNQNIKCIEITLRTSFAWEAVELFKNNYGDEFKALSCLYQTKAKLFKLNVRKTPGRTKPPVR